MVVVDTAPDVGRPQSSRMQTAHLPPVQEEATPQLPSDPPAASSMPAALPRVLQAEAMTDQAQVMASTHLAPNGFYLLLSSTWKCPTPSVRAVTSFCHVGVHYRRNRRHAAALADAQSHPLQ